jgi:ubiquinone/menaquinone biosynthesis C-methylase UbiE
MSEEQQSENNAALEMLASQLACPSGEFGIMLAKKMNESNIKMAALVAKALAPQKGDAVLEVGLGNGMLSLPILELIGDKGIFVAVEKSDVMVDEANTLFKKKGYKNAYVKHSEFAKIEVQENTLMGIISANVLYFIDDLKAFVERAYYCLNTGGKFVTGFSSPNALKGQPFAQYGFIAYEPDAVIATMEEAGFKNITSDYHLEGEVEVADQIYPVDAIIIKGEK